MRLGALGSGNDWNPPVLTVLEPQRSAWRILDTFLRKPIQKGDLEMKKIIVPVFLAFAWLTVMLAGCAAPKAVQLPTEAVRPSPTASLPVLSGTPVSWPMKMISSARPSPNTSARSRRKREQRSRRSERSECHSNDLRVDHAPIRG